MNGVSLKITRQLRNWGTAGLVCLVLGEFAEAQGERPAPRSKIKRASYQDVLTPVPEDHSQETTARELRRSTSSESSEQQPKYLRSEEVTYQIDDSDEAHQQTSAHDANRVTGDKPCGKYADEQWSYHCPDCLRKVKKPNSKCPACEKGKASCDEMVPFSCAGGCKTTAIDAVWDGNLYGDRHCCGTLQRWLGSQGCCDGYNWLDQFRLRIGGWASFGTNYNFHHPNNHQNNPVGMADRANEVHLNQAYLSIERQTNQNEYDWDIGGRVDYLYGTDWFYVSSGGLDIASPKEQVRTQARYRGTTDLYDHAIPQLYADIYSPYCGGWLLRFGHFYSLLGSESAQAVDNFFYTLSYTKLYGEPFTHTGATLSHSINCNWDFTFGFTRGWDNWEDINTNLSGIARLQYQSVDKRTRVSAAVHSGNEDILGINNRTTYSLVLAHDICPDLHWVLQHDLGVEQDQEVDNDFGIDASIWYSLYTRLIYDVSDTFSIGGRFEWFRDQDNARVIQFPFSPLSSGGTYLTASLGANWSPHPCVTVRPEFRWDYGDTRVPLLSIRGPYDGYTEKNQFMLATSVTIRF